MNRVTGGPWPVSARAAALHKTLAIADMHADTLLWQRNPGDRATRGHVDLPRLQDGNVALQVFSSVTKTPMGQNYESNGGRHRQHHPARDRPAPAGADVVRPMRSSNARCGTPRSCTARPRRAAGGCASSCLLPTSTGCSPNAPPAVRSPARCCRSKERTTSKGRIANLSALDAAGFRMIGLAHFFDNELAGSMHGLKKGGLTPFGAQIVADMERRGMIVDLAHCSHACFADVMRVATRPVVVSHGGVKATCATNRNLSDDELRALAKNGGRHRHRLLGRGGLRADPGGDGAGRSATRSRSWASTTSGWARTSTASVTTGFDVAHLERGDAGAARRRLRRRPGARDHGRQRAPGAARRAGRRPDGAVRRPRAAPLSRRRRRARQLRRLPPRAPGGRRRGARRGARRAAARRWSRPSTPIRRASSAPSAALRADHDRPEARPARRLRGRRDRRLSLRPPPSPRCRAATSSRSGWPTRSARPPSSAAPTSPSARSGRATPPTSPGSAPTTASPRPSFAAVTDAAGVISSSRIRDLLRGGDPAAAADAADPAVHHSRYRSSTAPSSAGRSASRPPTCGSATISARPTASMPSARGSTAAGSTASPTSASGRCSSRRSNCSRSICSTGRATSTGGRSTLRSSPTSAPNGSSTGSTR